MLDWPVHQSHQPESHLGMGDRQVGGRPPIFRGRQRNAGARDVDTTLCSKSLSKAQFDSPLARAVSRFRTRRGGASLAGEGSVKADGLEDERSGISKFVREHQCRVRCRMPPSLDVKSGNVA